jgi:hypothetical protein
VTILGLFAGAGAAQGAFVIDDKSFFSGIEHTFLDFESDGSGAPLDLPFKGQRFMSADEYSSSGIVFSQGSSFWWENVPRATCCDSANPLGHIGDAVAAVGSPLTVFGGGVNFAIDFTSEVHSFGVAVIQDGWTDVPSPDIAPTITAFDASGDELGVVRLWDELVDGGFGGLIPPEYGEHYFIPYGFMGLASETPIARIVFTNGAAFDDLHFSAIPAPGAGAALGLLTLGALARRRR